MNRLIQKSHGDRIVVREAYDGVEALDLIEEFEPDLLITDMRMPRMDGLELLRQARLCRPDLLTAVVSAYSDYSYVREAMRNGAADYLLKPATAGDMQELLYRLEGRFRQQETEKRKAAIALLLQGVSATDTRIPASLRGFSYMLLLVCEGPYMQGAADLMDEPLQRDSTIIEDCRQYCEGHGIRFWALGGERPNERFAVLAGGSDRDRDHSRHLLERVRSQLDGRKKPCTVLVAGPGLSAGQLRAAGKRLRRELLHRLVFGKSSLFHVHVAAPPKTGGSERFSQETARVMESLMNKRYDQLPEALLALMTAWEDGGATQFVVQQTLFRMLAELGDDGLARQIDLDMLVSHSLSYAELKHQVTLLFHGLLESPQGTERSSQVDSLVGQIEQYLRLHFREAITLQSLSQQFRLVPNYLSVVFKREMGVTPVEYLMNYRIGQAKRMMDERPDLLLKQVASEVGYPDPLYFSRVFKKQTGQSPTEYALSGRKAETDGKG